MQLVCSECENNDSEINGSKMFDEKLYGLQLCELLLLVFCSLL